MKFSEFKKLVKEYQKLKMNLDAFTNPTDQEKIDKNIRRVEKELGDNFSKIPEICTFNARHFLHTILLEYINVQPIDSLGYAETYEYNRKYCLKFKYDPKFYELATLSNKITLDCLFEDKYETGWEELFNLYPDLKEYLWECVERNYIATQKNRVSLLRTMLNKNNQEIEFLSSPEKVEERKKELQEVGKTLETEIAQIEDSIDEI